MKRSLTALLVAFASAASLAIGVAAGPNTAATARLIRVTSPVHRGDFATLVARVVPSRRCSIFVYYDKGRSIVFGLSPRRPINRRVSWTWKVPIGTKTGRWPIRVACGSAGSFRTSFVVTRAE